VGLISDRHYWTVSGRVIVTKWALILGNILEWYESAVYGYFADEIADNFFQGSSTAAWLGYVVSFVARPFGGILLGVLADVKGRRIATMTSLVGMVVATVGQGCIPSELCCGAGWATPGAVILVILRLVQGLSTGGEISAVSVFLAESTPTKAIGMSTALVSVGGNMGFVLAATVHAIIAVLLTSEQVKQWGWRVPFLVAIVPGLTSIILRRELKETKAFITQTDAYAQASDDDAYEASGGNDQQDALLLQEKQYKDSFSQVFRPVVEMYKHSKAEALVAFLGMAGISAHWYIVVYLQTFFTDRLGFSERIASWLAIVSQGVPLLLCPLVGLLTDMFGVGRIMLFGSISMLLAVPGFELLAVYQTHLTAYIVVGVFAVIQGLAGATPYLFVLELFPVSQRGLAMGITYNASVALFGGVGALAADAWAKSLLVGPGILIAGSGLISFVTISIARRSKSVQTTHIRHHPY